MVEDEPKPEVISDAEKMRLFKDLINEMGESDVRLLLYNTMGKLQVGENEALELFRKVLASGAVSCYGIDGWKREDGLDGGEVYMRLVFDKPVFFISMMAPPRNMRKEIKEKMIRAKLAEKFKKPAVDVEDIKEKIKTRKYLDDYAKAEHEWNPMGDWDE